MNAGDMNEYAPFLGSSADPFAEFGVEATDRIIHDVSQLSPADRKEMLQEVLDSLEPGLYSKVAQKATSLTRRGRKPQEALKTAMRVSLATGLLGQAKRVGGLSGVDTMGCCQMCSPTDLSGWWSNTKSKIKKAAKATKKAISNAACAAVNSGLAQTAAGLAQGGKLGERGMSVLEKRCGGGSGGGDIAPVAPPPRPKTAGMLEQMWPILAVGGVVAFVVMNKKKRR